MQPEPIWSPLNNIINFLAKTMGRPIVHKSYCSIMQIANMYIKATKLLFLCTSYFGSTLFILLQPGYTIPGHIRNNKHH